MAHHYMQERVKDMKIEYLVDSCGLYAYTGDNSTKNAIEVMKNYHVSLENHRAKNILDTNIKEYDLIICMTLQHKEQLLALFPNCKEKIYTLKEYVNSSIEDKDVKDPLGYGMETYEFCASEIVEYVDKLIEKF